MESRKYCAYNKTQASFLSLGITVADTVNERIRGQIENLARNAKSGLWLNPCRELPAGPGLPDFDVVYLDEDLQVVAVAESFPDASFKSPRPLPASALALPSHTIASSQTQCGDELIIWTTDGMGNKAAHSSKLVTQALMRFAPSPTPEDAAQPQPLSKREDAAEETESESGGKPSLMNRLKVWSAAKRAYRDGEITLSLAPAITPSAPARPVATAPAAAAPLPVASVPTRPDPFAAAPARSVQVAPAAATAPVRPVPITSAPIASEFVVPTAATLPPARSSQIKPPPVSSAPVRPAPITPSPATSEMVVPDAFIPAAVRPAPAAPASVAAAPVQPAVPIPAVFTPSPARQIPEILAPAISTPADSVPTRPASVTPVPPTSEFVIPTPAASTPLTSAPVKPEAAAPVQASIAPVAPGTESGLSNRPPVPGGFALLRAVENTARPSAPFERSNDKEQAESELLERPSLKTRYQTWAAEKAALRAADISLSIAPASIAPAPTFQDSIAAVPVVPASAAPASAPPSTEFVVPRQPPAPAGPILSRTLDEIAKPPALVERSDEREDSEPEPPERPSLISRYKIWSAERAARQAADVSLSIAPSPDVPAPARSEPVAPVRVASAPVIPAPSAPVPVETVPIPQIAVFHVAQQPPPDPGPVDSLSALPSSESLFARRPAVDRVPTSPLAGRVPAKSPAAVEPAEELKKEEPQPEEKPSLKIRFLRWLNNVRPTAQRQSKPGLVAYYWTGGTPKPHEVVNISATGLYLHTTEHWLPDTVILMTLQKIGGNPDNPEDSVSVLSKVVRQDDEGAGFEFVTSESANVNGSQYLPGKGIDKDALQRFLRQMKS